MNMSRVHSGKRKDPPIVVRAMADDIYEVQSYQGSHFLKLYRCVECDELASIDSYGDGNRVCSFCAGRERDRRRKESIEANSRLKNLENLKIAARKRSATLTLAAPAWRDRSKIKEIYDEAKRLTAETGIIYHVDHYYPLQGVLCCGLHVHQNLRVIPASDNCSKNNAQPLEDSPATVAFIKQYGEGGLFTWVRWAKTALTQC
jgi:hypothetical protein